MITFPFWLKVLLGWFGLLVVSGSIRFLSKRRRFDSFRELPAEERQKLIRICSSLLLVCKVMLWALPLNLVVVPFLVYIQSPEDFFHTFVSVAIAYMLVTEEFLFRRSMLAALNTADGPEHSRGVGLDSQGSGST